MGMKELWPMQVRDWLKLIKIMAYKIKEGWLLFCR